MNMDVLVWTSVSSSNLPPPFSAAFTDMIRSPFHVPGSGTPSSGLAEKSLILDGTGSGFQYCEDSVSLLSNPETAAEAPDLPAVSQETTPKNQCLDW